MLEEIRRLFAELHSDGKQPGHFGGGDYRVAAAALLVHEATLDGALSPPAREKLRSLLMVQFSLTDALTDELIEAALAADREAVDLYHFTSLLMRSLNEQGRARIIEMLWEMAYVNGSVSEFEDNMVWRVADLLAVPPNERIALRQRVAAAQPAKREP